MAEDTAGGSEASDGGGICLVNVLPPRTAVDACDPVLHLRGGGIAGLAEFACSFTEPGGLSEPRAVSTKPKSKVKQRTDRLVVRSVMTNPSPSEGP
jgi:hypothetical protein